MDVRNGIFSSFDKRVFYVITQCGVESFAGNAGESDSTGEYNGLEIFGTGGDLHEAVREDGDAGIFGQVVAFIVDDDGSFSSGAEYTSAVFHPVGGLI